MKEGTIHYFTYYFRRMLKFYELKVQGVPQVLFVLLLAAAFGFRLLVRPLVVDMAIYQQQLVIAYQDILNTGDMTDPSVMEKLMKIPFTEEYARFISLLIKSMGLLLVQQIVMMLLSYFYLGAYLTDMELNKASVTRYMSKFFRALPRYAAFNILFFIAVGILAAVLFIFSSLLIMIAPYLFVLMLTLPLILPVGWFIIQVIFIFKDIVFLDTGIGVFGNFSLSWRLSKGSRLIIGRNIFFLSLLNMVIGMVSIGSSVLLTMFVTSFLEVIVLLFRQRLTALMYYSRTRRIREEPAED